jgi:hypothetical protein
VLDLRAAREGLAVDDDKGRARPLQEIAEDAEQRIGAHLVLFAGIVEVLLGEDRIAHLVAIEHNCADLRRYAPGKCRLADAG